MQGDGVVMGDSPFDVPAIVSNRFSVTATDTIRIAFAEGAGGVDHYRTAVQMTRGDAGELMLVLARLLAPPAEGAAAPPEGAP